jgi:hypothetical protein
MAAFEDLGFNKQEYVMLNRLRIHQEVLYESDVFAADGRHIDPKYFYIRKASEKWYNLMFNTQIFPSGHLTLWKAALTELAPGGCRPRNLGKFVHMSRKFTTGDTIPQKTDCSLVRHKVLR